MRKYFANLGKVSFLEVGVVSIHLGGACGGLEYFKWVFPYDAWFEKMFEGDVPFLIAYP